MDKQKSILKTFKIQVIVAAVALTLLLASLVFICVAFLLSMIWFYLQSGLVLRQYFLLLTLLILGFV